MEILLVVPGSKIELARDAISHRIERTSTWQSLLLLALGNLDCEDLRSKALKINMSVRTDEDYSFDEWWHATHPKDSTVRPHVPRTVRDERNRFIFLVCALSPT